MTTETVRQNLINAMQRRQLLLSRLSEQSGISKYRLQGIIDGTKDIKLSEIPKLCSALAISPNDLFEA